MNEFRADLHCHTTCSDGSLSPTEIIHLAKKSNLNGLSITDHDSISAYENAVTIAKEAQVELISGVEFSAVHEGVNVHILGYSFAINHPAIQSLCERHQIRRQNRNRAILERLNDIQLPISEEDVLACLVDSPASTHHTIGRPHIAQAMIKKGYVDSIGDAFKLYLGEDKSCFVKGVPFSTQETIEIIHQANGFAIIAHPHLIKETQVIPKLLELPFDGLEGYYARLTPAQNERWVKIATKKNWLITGGSDFHGDVKPQIELGASWVREDTFRILQKRYCTNNL